MITNVIVAYSLIGNDNGAYFFEYAPHDIFCPICDTCLDGAYYPKDLKIPKKYDIGSTYDGRDIVSSAFKEFCETQYPSEVLFFL